MAVHPEENPVAAYSADELPGFRGINSLVFRGWIFCSLGCRAKGWRIEEHSMEHHMDMVTGCLLSL